eukprot:gene3867-4473_t
MEHIKEGSLGKVVMRPSSRVHISPEYLCNYPLRWSYEEIESVDWMVANKYFGLVRSKLVRDEYLKIEQPAHVLAALSTVDMSTTSTLLNRYRHMFTAATLVDDVLAAGCSSQLVMMLLKSTSDTKYKPTNKSLAAAIARGDLAMVKLVYANLASKSRPRLADQWMVCAIESGQTDVAMYVLESMSHYHGAKWHQTPAVFLALLQHGDLTLIKHIHTRYGLVYSQASCQSYLDTLEQVDVNAVALMRYILSTFHSKKVPLTDDFQGATRCLGLKDHVVPVSKALAKSKDIISMPAGYTRHPKVSDTMTDVEIKANLHTDILAGSITFMPLSDCETPIVRALINLKDAQVTKRLDETLVVATGNGLIRMVTLLLEHITPTSPAILLDVALFHRQFAMVELLLGRRTPGFTFTSLAAKGVGMFGDIDAFKLLVKASRTRAIETAYSTAQIYGRVRLVRYIRSLNLDSLLISPHPIAAIGQFGHWNLVNSYIQDTNTTTSPRHLDIVACSAVSANHVEFIRRLSKAVPAIDIDRGYIAKSVAYNHVEMVRELSSFVSIDKSCSPSSRATKQSKEMKCLLKQIKLQQRHQHKLLVTKGAPTSSNNNKQCTSA